MLTSKISNRVEILKQNFIQSAGLPFRDLLPQSTIQQIIDELQIKYYRRIFDPFVTIWAFLSQVLDAEKMLRADNFKAEVPNNSKQLYRNGANNAKNDTIIIK